MRALLKSALAATSKHTIISAALGGSRRSNHRVPEDVVGRLGELDAYFTPVGGRKWFGSVLGHYPGSPPVDPRAFDRYSRPALFCDSVSWENWAAGGAPWTFRGTAMPDHNAVMQEVIKSKAAVAQMGKPGTALNAKLDAIIAEMHRALQLRDGYKKAQTTLATLKKAKDDQNQRVAAAKAKNDAILAKNAEDVKYIEEKAKTVQQYSSLKDGKNKAIADAVNRVQLLAMTTLKQKLQYFDGDTYQAHADALTKYRKLLPKATTGNGLPQDLDLLAAKMDALVKKLQEAVAAAKAADQIRIDSNAKEKAFEDFGKKVQPIEDTLTKLVGQIAIDLGLAKEMNSQLDHTGSKEAYNRAGSVFKALNDAIADYDGADGKAWAAKP